MTTRKEAFSFTMTSIAGKSFLMDRYLGELRHIGHHERVPLPGKLIYVFVVKFSHAFTKAGKKCISWNIITNFLKNVNLILVRVEL